MTTMEEHQSAWIARARQAGHELKRDEDGDVDAWVTAYGYHNGPGCIRCGKSWCWHCVDPDQIEPCKGDEYRIANERASEDRVLAEADAIRARREASS